MFDGNSSSHHKKSHLATIIGHGFSLEALFSNTTHCLASYVPLAHVNWDWVQSISLSEFKMGGDVWIITVRIPWQMIIPCQPEGFFHLKYEHRTEMRTISCFYDCIISVYTGNGTIEVALKDICLQQTLDFCFKQMSKWKALKVIHCKLTFTSRLCEPFISPQKNCVTIDIFVYIIFICLMFVILALRRWWPRGSGVQGYP